MKIVLELVLCLVLNHWSDPRVDIIVLACLSYDTVCEYLLMVCVLFTECVTAVH
jgi:hypothetical protein